MPNKTISSSHFSHLTDDNNKQRNSRKHNLQFNRIFGIFYHTSIRLVSNPFEFEQLIQITIEFHWFSNRFWTGDTNVMKEF